MSDPYEVVTLGVDTSGRPLKMTRRMKQAFDVVNDHVGGLLVIVQGAFMGTGGASASAGTHALSGCLDIRTWNLTTAQRDAAMRKARSIGWAAWYRTTAQGFDPHMHWLLLGEQPMHADAAYQERAYRAGLNGLASGGPDDFWRPSPIPTYTYQQEEVDDMFEAADRQTLNGIAKAIAAFRQGERDRDAAEQERDAADRERDNAASLALAEILAAVDALPDGRIKKGDVRSVIDRAFAKHLGNGDPA